MWRIFLSGVASLSVLAVLGVGLWLWRAHAQIGALNPALPSWEVGDTGDFPVRVEWINTASQPASRSLALDRSLDPEPDAPFVMSHPAFVLTWEDGRRFLFDVGMTPEGAREFERLFLLLASGDPGALESHGAAAAQLGPALADVRGIAFSHLHPDHVEGIAAICEARRDPIPVFQVALQAGHTNHTTAPTAEQLAKATCVERRSVGKSGRVPGFPGLRLVPVAGHTPGSQILVARVEGAEPLTWIFTGDVVAHAAAIEHDIPLGWSVTRYLTPQNAEQLGRVRRWLAEARRAGARIAVNHDGLDLEANGPPRFAP